MGFSILLCLIGFASEYQRDATIHAQHILLQNYRDRQIEYVMTNQKIVDNLKLIANLPVIPEKYKPMFTGMIDSLKATVVEDE